MDWGHAASAIVGAAVVALVVLRWRTHSRSRDIFFEWHSKARDDSTSTKADEP